MNSTFNNYIIILLIIIILILMSNYEHFKTICTHGQCFDNNARIIPQLYYFQDPLKLDSMGEDILLNPLNGYEKIEHTNIYN